MRDKSEEKGGETGLGAATDGEHLVVIDELGGAVRLGGDASRKIGDEGEAENGEAHVAGDDDFVHGGHADEGGAEGAEGADLGGGFEGRAEDGEIDAFGKGDALLGCFSLGEGAESDRVGGGHIEEAFGGAGAGGEAGLIGADGGVSAGEIDVVGDEDKRAGGIRRVDAACCICNDERSATEKREDAGGKDDLGEGISLVGVNTTLENSDRDAGDGAEDELAGVTDNGGEGEVGDPGVGDCDGVGNVRGEVAEPRAENDAEDWREM